MSSDRRRNAASDHFALLRSFVGRRVASLTTADRWVYGVVATVVGVGLLVPLALGVLDPRLPLSAHHWGEEGSRAARFDPWGAPWERLGSREAPEQQLTYVVYSSFPYVVYSRGPDGVDERGRGDDAFVLPESSTSLTVYRSGLASCLLLATALAGGWELSRATVLRKRSPDLRIEAVRVALLSAPLLLLVAGAGVVAAFFLGERLDPLLSPLRERLLVPLGWAWLGTAALLAVVAAIGIRVSRPSAPTIEEAPPGPSSN